MQYQAKLEQIAKESGMKGIPSTSKLAGEDVAQLTDALHRFVARLKEIEPPAAAARLHQGLIKALNDLADEFPDIAKKLKGTKDPSAAITALFGAKGVQELARLGEEFRKAGYELNLSGS